MNGRIITVTWLVVAALAITTGCGLTPVAVEFAAGSTDAVDFGYLPQLNMANHRAQTYTAWVYYDADVTSNFHTIMSMYGGADGKGWLIRLTNVAGSQVYFVFDAPVWSGANASFYVAPEALTPGQWVLVVISYDSSLTSNEPAFYVNGTLKTTSVSVAPSGSFSAGGGQSLIVGNSNYSGHVYDSPFDGKIFSVKIYNRILTQAEITTEYNSGTPDASVESTDGLAFHAFSVRSGDTGSYVDQTLTSSTKLFDSQFKYVGTPNGSPIGRAAP